METVGGYELDGLIGRGTSGTVWRAYRPGPVRQSVAVKRARPVTGGLSLSRLRDEATILADLDHPHIVRVLDVLDDDGDVAIVMQLARGGSLEDLLAERGTLDPGQVVAILAPVAAALGSAHRRGVLHGDVKPANILFTSDGEPLLSDFGVARNLLARPGSRDAVAGTAAYLDPEAFDQPRPEPRNDIYAVCVVAYLALTGRLPYVSDDADELVARADRGSHISLLDERSVPASLAEVVEAGFARDPAVRPRTADDLAHALRSAVAASTIALPGVARLSDGLVEVTGTGASAEAAVGAVHHTRPFGPRPVRFAGAVAAPRRRWVAVGVLALIASGLLSFVLTRESGPDGDRPTSTASGAPRSGPPDCPNLPEIAVGPGGSRLEADFRGDGCVVPVVWDGAVAQFRLSPADATPRRYDFKKLLGAAPVRQEGGRLLIGDWDCDGVDSPALYNPATGIVHYFGAIPLMVGAELAADREERTGIEDGRAQLKAGVGDQCDEVVVGRSA